MERIQNLGRYERAILLLMLIMVLIFTVIYPMVTSKNGFYYKEEILSPTYDRGNTIYSGQINGKQATFTVSTDHTVTFQYGDQLYGPYAVKQDDTAVPKDSNMYDAMDGIELTCGDTIIFRGGVYKTKDFRLFVNEDGESVGLADIEISGDSILTDEYGNIIDPMEPSIATVFDLLEGPKLTHKGSWINWFFGVLICVFTAISIMYADELFRLGISFKVSNPQNAEPSDWALAGRYVGWTALPVYALVLFIQGLQYID